MVKRTQTIRWQQPTLIQNVPTRYAHFLDMSYEVPKDN